MVRKKVLVQNHKVQAMTTVFQYGSNTNFERLNSSERLAGNASLIGLAYTKEMFELDFTTWSSRNNCASADIISGKGRHVWGVLYEVPDHLISRKTSDGQKSFDAIEGTNYHRIPIKLKHPDGSDVVEEVVTYVVKEKRPGLRTSLDYVRHILSGLRSHNVPSDYIEYVKQRIRENNPALSQDISGL